jgi:2-dehydro-3-deoxygluconokinase
MSTLSIRPAGSCRWDIVALGEVMLRLDPGEGRIATTRHFTVWEGGGEYNVARGLARCFGMRSAVVTALVDNPVGRLLEDFMRQGAIDRSHVTWVPFDGVGRSARNGLNFTERGYGVRAALGVYDRGHTAGSRMRAGDIDWDTIFGLEGARWFHTGGIFAALSETTPGVVREAVEAARRHGTIVSYDLNYPTVAMEGDRWPGQGAGSESRPRRLRRRPPRE